VTKKRKRKESKMAGDTNVIERADGPAKAGPGQMFVIEPIASGSGHGQVKRARNSNEHPLTRAFDLGKITAEEYSAGEIYRDKYEKRDRSGKDSTDLSIPSGRSGTPWTQEQAEAALWLKAVEGRLSEVDCKIIRMVCGQKFKPNEALEAILIDIFDSKRVFSRFREALRSLIKVIQSSQRRAA
jgi:hypothetical protein